jgi:hypothetical protein
MSRPNAPEHNCDYRTPGVSLVISAYLCCSRVFSVPHFAGNVDALEAEAVAGVTKAVKDLRCASMNFASLSLFASSLSALFAPVTTLDNGCCTQLIIINSLFQSIATNVNRRALFAMS